MEDDLDIQLWEAKERRRKKREEDRIKKRQREEEKRKRQQELQQRQKQEDENRRKKIEEKFSSSKKERKLSSASTIGPENRCKIGEGETLEIKENKNNDNSSSSATIRRKKPLSSTRNIPNVSFGAQKEEQECNDYIRSSKILGRGIVIPPQRFSVDSQTSNYSKTSSITCSPPEEKKSSKIERKNGKRISWSHSHVGDQNIDCNNKNNHSGRNKKIKVIEKNNTGSPSDNSTEGHRGSRRRRRRLHHDSPPSSDDSDEDLVALAKKLKAVNQNTKNESKPEPNQSSEAEEGNGGDSEIKPVHCETGDPRETQQTKITKARHRRGRQGYSNDDDDDSSSSDNLVQFSRQIQDKQKVDKIKHNPIAMEKRQREEERKMLQQINSPSQRHEEKKQQTIFSSPDSNNRSLLRNLVEDDNLWDDSDNADNDDDDGDEDEDDDASINREKPKDRKSTASKTRKKQAKRKANIEKIINDSSPTAKVASPSEPLPIDNGRRNKKSRDSTKNHHGNAYTDSIFEGQHDDCFSDDEEEKERIRKQLKPSFDNPKWPPSDLRPFDMTSPYASNLFSTLDEVAAGDGNSVGTNETYYHQVPASINRYLKQYQRDGVIFLYNGISQDKGVILGDEMGLGKTVQVISLIAALLKKTGTGKDLLELKQKRREIYVKLRAKLQRERDAKDKALLQGRVLDHVAPVVKQEDCLNVGNEELINDDISTKYKPILIVVPPSVMSNWRKEFHTWGHFGVCLYSGKDRTQILTRIGAGLDEIMIIGRALFTFDDDLKALLKIPWKLVVVDEYHEYKNHESIGYMHLEALKRVHNCPIIGLTGTPLQNDHYELYNLVNLVQPNFLGSWDRFENDVSKPVKYGRTKDATEDDIRRSNQRIKELQKVLEPVLLMRKKAEVDELKETLPTKDEKVVFCELSSIQKRIYEHIINNLPDYKLLRYANAPCDCGINQTFFIQYKRMRTKKEKIEFQRRRKKEIIPRKKCCYRIPLNPKRNEDGQSLIDPKAVLWRTYHSNDRPCPEDRKGPKCPFCISFPAILKLSKVCSHAALMQLDRDPCTIELRSKERLDAEKNLKFLEVALPPDVLKDLPGKSYVREDGIMDEHMELSGKMKALSKLLRDFSRKGDRILLFSLSTKTLDLIENYIKSEGYSFLRLDGSTPVSHRGDLVDKFEADNSIFLFLISTRAGGLGLNLVAANVVILFDVNWNPSYDEQAQDRAYRIGQRKDVQVIRLVARGTLEELQYIRQIYKVQLKQETLDNVYKDAPKSDRMFYAVAGDDDRKGEMFGMENLLKYKDGSFLKDIWKSAGGQEAPGALGGVDYHRTQAVSDAVSKLSVDDIERIGEDEFDEQFDRAAENNTTPEKAEDEGSARSKVGNDEDDNILKNDNVLNHEDFMRSDRGQAIRHIGDEGVDEEMGGFSQAVHDVIEEAQVNFAENDMDDASQDIDVQKREKAQAVNEPQQYYPAFRSIVNVDVGMEEPIYRHGRRRFTTHDPEQNTLVEETASIPIKEEKLISLFSSNDISLNKEKQTAKESTFATGDVKLQTSTVGTDELQAIRNGINDTATKVGSSEKIKNNLSPKQNESNRLRRRRQNIRLMGVSQKRMKKSHLKSKFTADDILDHCV